MPNRVYGSLPGECDCLEFKPYGDGHCTECGGTPRLRIVRPGPPCTCVQASDTGYDTECPRAAYARGALS